MARAHIIGAKRSTNQIFVSGLAPQLPVQCTLSALYVCHRRATSLLDSSVHQAFVVTGQILTCTLCPLGIAVH
jgi:hypothetical protein